MKIILLIAPCLLGICMIGIAQAAKLTPAVQRTLARQLAMIVVDSGLSPLRSAAAGSVQHYVDGYRHKIIQAFTKETQILDSYLQLLVDDSDTRVDMPALAQHLDTVINTVGQSYAERQRGIFFRARDTQQFLVVGLQNVSDNVLPQREGEVSLRHLYDRLRQLSVPNEGGKELQTMAEDAYEFLSHYPQFDNKITDKELAYLLNYARQEHTTAVEIESEIVKVLNQQVDVLSDLRRKQLTIFDLITPSNHLGKLVQERLSIGELFLGERGWQNLSDKLNYSALLQDEIMGELPLNFGITFEQLFERRFLTGVTQQFLLAMHWSWHEFSNMIFPNDSKQAALFVIDYSTNMMQKETQALVGKVIQAERAKLSDAQQISVVDAYLEELPTLIAKEMFMKLAIITLTDTHSLAAEQEKQRLLQQANNYYKQDMTKWDYFPVEILERDITLPDIVLNFLRAGVPVGTIEREILTLPIVVKLVKGQITTEKDLNDLRKKINAENLQALVAETAKARGHLAEEILENIEWAYYVIPMAVQRDGFLKKVVNGMGSNHNLLKVLEKIEEDSIYRPMAVKLLQEASSLSKRKRQNFLNSIRTVIKKNKKLANDTLQVNEFLGLSIPELPGVTIDQGEQPVELPNPEILRQQEKQLRRLKREAQRARQPAKKAVVPSETAEVHRQKAQHEAAQQTKRELARRITKLSNMIGKVSLPTDTPVWLHLRAIINYADADIQQLAQRTDLQDMQARFFALTANEATVLPTKEELMNITLALEKHIRKNKNMLKPEKSKMLDNMRAEMAELLDLIAIEG